MAGRSASSRCRSGRSIAQTGMRRAGVLAGVLHAFRRLPASLRDYCAPLTLCPRPDRCRRCTPTFPRVYRDKIEFQRKAMERQFTAIIEKRGKWHVASVEEIPGVNTQGRTLAEVRRNLKEAIQLVVEATRELGARERSREAKPELITVRG